MKLKEYIIALQEIAKNKPESLEWNLIYSDDDEGNSYNQVSYTPSTCLFEDNELVSYEYDENDEEIEVPDKKHNCIIIN